MADMSLAEMMAKVNWGNVSVSNQQASFINQQNEAVDEQKYQDQLQKRIDKYKIMGRLKADLAKAGIGVELTDEEKYQRLLDKRLKGYETAKRLKVDLAKAGIGVEQTEEQKYQRLLDRRIKQYETAKRLKADLAKLGIDGGGGGGGGGGALGAVGRGALGMFGLGGLAGGPAMAGATAALIAFRGAVQAATEATNLHYASLQRGPTGAVEENVVNRAIAVQRKARDTNPLTAWLYNRALALTGRSKPTFGEEGYYAEGDISSRAYMRDPRNLTREQFNLAQMSGARRDYLNFVAQQNVGLTSARGSILMGGMAERRALENRMAGFTGGMLGAAGLRRAQYGTISQFGGLHEAAIAGTEGMAGYTREAQLADIGRQLAFQQQQQQIAAQGAASLVGTNLQLGGAEAHEAGMRNAAGIALAREGRADSELKRVQKGKLGIDAELRAAHELQAAIEQRKQIEQSLQEAQKQTLDLRQQKEQQILAIQQQQHQAVQAQLQAVNQAIQAEQNRKKALNQGLALMHPMQLRTMRGIAQKAAAGRPLTVHEIGFMQAHQDVFGGQLQEVAARRMQNPFTAAAIADINRLTGQGRREQGLQQERLKLENEIRLQVQFDEASIARAMVEKVEPALRNILLQIDTLIDVRLRQVEHGGYIQRRAQFPTQQG